MPVPAASLPRRDFRKPGFLTEPLGWVQARLGPALELEPCLVELLFGLNQARMHLMALALAHTASDITPDFALMLFKGFQKPVLQLSLGHQYPFGIDRALHRLPPKVLAPDAYRQLAALLNDPVTAKFLHHTPSITERMIAGLHDLPPILRTAAVLELFSQVSGMNKFADGIRYLASRMNLPFNTLATQIGTLDQAGQIVAEIKKVVESLPLPDKALPTEVGDFRRLDCVNEIRDLAKRWDNCLASCLLNVNDGTAAIYLSDRIEAVCYVSRYGRLGWVLQQTKGPNNVNIEPSQLRKIQDTFAYSGIHTLWMIEAINNIIHIQKWHGHNGFDGDEDIFDDLEVF